MPQRATFSGVFKCPFRASPPQHTYLPYPEWVERGISGDGFGQPLFTAFRAFMSYCLLLLAVEKETIGNSGRRSFIYFGRYRIAMVSESERFAVS